MALVKFGAGVSEMRGKEGGVIYSRNAYGAYIKAKVSPVNPNTQKQQDQRSLMGNLSKAWATLTPAQVAAWDNLGDQVTRVNRFGDSTNYTGFSLFMRLNRNLSVVGESFLTTAPGLPTLSELTISGLAAAAGTSAMSMTIAPSPLEANEYLVVYATNNILTARTFVKNFYRQVYLVLAPTTPANLHVQWNAYFGNLLIEGAKIYIKAKIIDQDTGFDTVPQVASCVVAA